MTTKYKNEKGKIEYYEALDTKCGKKDCFIPFSGNGRKICRLYELGKCKESKV